MMKSVRYTKETISSLGTVERNFPEFSYGDTIAIMQKVKEGNKERLQLFEGDVIAIHNNGASSTFTVRKMAAGNIAVERIFPYYSPVIDSIKVIRRGKVRRAKLYYLRKLVGRAARITEKRETKQSSPAAV